MYKMITQEYKAFFIIEKNFDFENGPWTVHILRETLSTIIAVADNFLEKSVDRRHSQ